MVLFSLNGLVPDDINNTFSNKNCAIIEDLSAQIGSTEFISIYPTDTAIKGTVNLSKKAIILIRDDIYNSLSRVEKYALELIDPDIITFNGDLTAAVEHALSASGVYQPEKLSLSRADHGYIASDTSEETIKVIREIAQTYNISQELFFNILTGQTDLKEELSSVKDEFSNYLIVTKFYQDTFLKYLFERIDVSPDLQYLLLNFGARLHMDRLCEIIELFGFDKYKQLVAEYNVKIEQLKAQEALPTPIEIVASCQTDAANNLFDLAMRKATKS
jgi:hypothetical protein